MKGTVQKFNVRQYMTDPDYEIFSYQDYCLNKVDLHSHDFYEIYFFLSGNVQYSIEGRNYLLVPGDLLLIGPTELHQSMISQGNQAYSRIVLWIAENFLKRSSTKNTSLSGCFDVEAPGHTNLLRLEETDRISVASLLDGLVRERHSPQYGSDLMAPSLLTQLLVTVNRIAQTLPQRHELEDQSSGIIYDILNYINSHYQENLSLDGLAAQFFISKYHLSHEFTRLVGTSVYRYVIKKRLLIARKFLSEGGSPMNICRQCGFGDYTNFYRSFRAEYHISPKEYMRSIQHFERGDQEISQKVCR